MTIGEAARLATHPVYRRFCALVEGPLTASVSIQHSAYAGQFYLRWQGVNGVGHGQRVNPLGADLEEVLVELAGRCRKLSELAPAPAPAPARSKP